MKIGTIEIEQVQDSTSAIVRPRLVKRQEPIEARPEDFGPVDKAKLKDWVTEYKARKSDPRQEFQDLFVKY